MFKKLTGAKWFTHSRDPLLAKIDRDIARKEDLLARSFNPLEKKRLKTGLAQLRKERSKVARQPPTVSFDDAKNTLKVVKEAQYNEWRRAQKKEPVRICKKGSDKYVWWFKDGFYQADLDLKANDIRALALEQDNQKRLQLEKAHALMAMRDRLDTKAKRQPIPQEVKLAVWQRDQGRCVDCGSQAELEYDHVIPLAMGGSNTERNIQLLCAVCNRRKGATLG